MEMANARNKLIRQLSFEIKDQKVLEIMSRIPRELFIPTMSQHLAYENIPLPIAMGQTISQPFIVALMTEALALDGTEKVLEIGTGSGYQTAILCEIAKRVITVERHELLLENAKNVLHLLQYNNVELHIAGKKLGWPEEAPFNAVIVTAGAPNIAPELLDQLDIGGRLVIPVGSPFDQDLIKIIKHKKGTTKINLGACRFVPLIGESAWNADES